MIIHKNQTVNNISAKISVTDIEVAKAYIQGAVHSHCNTSPDKPLSVRFLFGGDNRDWADTPLQIIYDYHKCMQAVNPAEQAAKDVGWLFKQVLKDDSRTFEYVGKDTGSISSWNSAA
ncbi:MAG: hypothetical protein IJ766_06440 [Clostridia bacterium]|nr:hypothetical protein [Clostridia bacterium]